MMSSFVFYLEFIIKFFIRYLHKIANNVFYRLAPVYILINNIKIQPRLLSYEYIPCPH